MSDFKQQYFDHFSDRISQGIVDFVTDVVFKRSRYIFTRREGKIQNGYCTHCNQEFTTKGLKHNEHAHCPKCDSWCQIKASGRGRKTLVDEAYFVYYEKSVVNPRAITARGIYAVRDYRFDFRKVETLFETKSLYVFETGGGRMIYRPWLFYSCEQGMCNVSEWREGNSVFSMFNNSCMSNKPCYYSKESIMDAVVGTPFQYSTWQQYLDGDMVKFFDLAAKYPCVEYLTKLGMQQIVEAKLIGTPTYGAINWRGKTPQAIIKLNKQDFADIRSLKTPIGPLFLKLYQTSKRDGSNLTFKQIYEILRAYGSYFDDVKILLKLTKLSNIHSYITKQFEKKNKKHYLGIYQVLHTWRDYVADCRTLGLDLSQEAILFPSNLHRAHQNTIKQVKVKEDEELNKKIALRVATLKKLSFHACGYILRPAFNSKELIEEGKALQHCVGTYAEKYAKGVTDLFFIRKLEEPDKPFFTMEIQNGGITQIRGMKNCLPTNEVQNFVNRFKAEKLEKKKSKSNKRQEVAV